MGKSQALFYQVQSGDLNWKGKAFSWPEAIKKAFKNFEGGLGELIRIRNGKEKVWRYVSTQAAIKIADKDP